MANTRRFEIEVLGDVRKATSAIESLDKGVGGLGKSLKTFAGAFAGAFAVDQVVSGLGTMIKAAEESQKVTKETEAILKATGNTAGLTADQIGKLSTALSNKTAVDDEVIQKNQNVLLTFTNIRNEVGAGNDVFNRASAAMLDLGQVFGSVDSAAMQLGKALNDPVKGMSALARSGVSFSEDQQKAIRAMVESNNVLGAQKIILGEVERQVGGTAAATATNSDRMRVAFGNLQETVGAKLLPVVERFSGWMVQSGIPAMERFAGWVERNVVPALQNAGRWIRDDLVPAFMRLADWVEKNVLPVLRDLGDWLSARWPSLVAAAKIIIDDLKKRFEGIAQALRGVVDFIGGIFQGEWGRAWDGLKNVAAGAFKAIIGDAPAIMLDALKAIGGGLNNVGRSIAERVVDGLKTVFTAAVNWMIDQLNKVIEGFDRLTPGNIGSISRISSGSGGGGGTVPLQRQPIGVLAPGATYNPSTGVTTPAPRGLAGTGTIGSTLQRSIVANAKAMLGKSETDPGLVKALGRDLQGEANAWCQLYVNQVFKSAGVPLPNSGSESTRTTVEALKKAGMGSATPVVGGLAYKTRGAPGSWKGHVGIVTAYDPRTGMVTTVEGNSGNKVAQKTSKASAWDLGFINPFGKGAKTAVNTSAGTLSPTETATATRTTASSSRSTARSTQQTAEQTERVKSGIDILREQGLSAADATRQWRELVAEQGGDQARALQLLKAAVDQGNDADERARSSSSGSPESLFADAVEEFAMAVAAFVGGGGGVRGGGSGGLVGPIRPIPPPPTDDDRGGGGGGGGIIGVNPTEGEVRTEADGSVWMFTGGRWVKIQDAPPPIYGGQSGQPIIVNVHGSVITERELGDVVGRALARSGQVRPDGTVSVRR